MNLRKAFASSLPLLLLSMLSASPGDADAVGLGRLTVLSTLGKRLEAEVELTDALVGDQPLAECFRLGDAADSGSDVPLLSQGRVTLEQYGGRYRLRIVSDRPITESALRINLRKGCGAEVARTYQLSIGGATRARGGAMSGPLQLPSAEGASGHHFGGGSAEENRSTAKQGRLGRYTSARQIARNRFPGRASAQARYVRALQAANPTVDLGSRGQNLLPAGTRLNLPTRRAVTRIRLPLQSESTSASQGDAQGTARAASGERPLDRLLVSRGPDGAVGRPGATAAMPLEKPGDKAGISPDMEARLLAAIDVHAEQQRLLSEKLRLLDERIRELQQTIDSPATAGVAPPAPAPTSSPSPAAAPAAAPAASPTAPGAASPPAEAAVSAPVARPAEPPAVRKAAGEKGGSWWLEGLGVVGVIVLLAWLLRRRASAAAQPRQEPVERRTGGALDEASKWQLVGQSEGFSSFGDKDPHSKRVLAAAPSAPSRLPSEQEEATAVLELAEIMVSFGRLAGAAQAIEEFLEIHPKTAVAPWLKLLEIYRQSDQREAFDALGIKLRQHFNVAPAEWASMEEHPASSLSVGDVQSAPIEQLIVRMPSIGQLPHIQAEILRTWDSPACPAYLDKLLRDNRNGERRGFTLGTVRELLLLADLCESRLKRRY